MWLLWYTTVYHKVTRSLQEGEENFRHRVQKQPFIHIIYVVMNGTYIELMYSVMSCTIGIGL